ncbi:MAG: iron-containing alcohol dehydrogenase [Syntrophomonadaceae bacterium]|nr:iron-containing alcohol dehydrogenase [Syntrophomonadaceae bacterium]
MLDLEHFMPTHLHFGRGKTNKIGELCIPIGRKALIVTGKNSTKATGLLERTINILQKSGIESVVFDRVPENPLTTTVEEGVALFQIEKCDFVIGLGGGSPIDTAKGIAFMAVNPGNISDYIFGRPGNGAAPVIAIPTTAGTGSEADSLAVFTNPETCDKKSLKSPYIYPRYAIIDPELMTTLPPHLIAATGFDALCHAIEAFIAQGSTPLSDLLALQAIKTISLHLPRVFQNPNDLEAWDEVAFGSTLGGMVIDRAGVVLVHGLEHPLSGLYNIRHGEGLAALMPACLAFSLPEAQHKLSLVTQAMGEETDVVAAINKLRKQIGLDFTLSQLGVKASDLDWLTENSLRATIKPIQNSPRVPNQQEIKAIYSSCL